jgi:hypothetical protein
MKKKKKRNDKKEIIVSLVLITLMLLMGVLNLCYAYEEYKWLGTPTTTAIFYSCGESVSDESGPTTYKAKYTYYINGEPYKAELNLTSKECTERPTKEINYNPDNPSEYNSHNIIFSFIASLVSGIFLIVTYLALLIVIFLPNKKKEA